MPEANELLDIKQASVWATEFLGKSVTTANISYLINYGRVKKIGGNESVLVSKNDLLEYYRAAKNSREFAWKDKLGDDLNWTLSFDQYTESQTTKHVHRLHPYKGKFIPQLVEYFLDSHTDKFKQEVFFKKGNIVLDPFCGNGTTLVQANELGINAIGIDISKFNALISNVKIQVIDFDVLRGQINTISVVLRKFVLDCKHLDFETDLVEILNKYNNEFFLRPNSKSEREKKKLTKKNIQNFTKRKF